MITQLDSGECIVIVGGARLTFASRRAALYALEFETAAAAAGLERLQHPITLAELQARKRRRIAQRLGVPVDSRIVKLEQLVEDYDSFWLHRVTDELDVLIALRVEGSDQSKAQPEYARGVRWAADKLQAMVHGTPTESMSVAADYSARVTDRGARASR